MHYPEFVSDTVFYNMDESLNIEKTLLNLAHNIKSIYLLSVQNYESFEELIESYLHAGITIFQMQTGIVSHITKGSEYHVKDVVTNLDGIQKNDLFELEGTYCHQVYLAKKTLGFPHVANIPELKHHPVYVNLKLEAYISAPIFVNKKLYGTLNFTSQVPREHGFSEHEHDLISMMAQAIGSFILLQKKENKLKKINARRKELIGHLSHDIRSPIGTILTFSELAQKPSFTKSKKDEILKIIHDESQRSLNLVNNILDEAALGSGKVPILFEEFDFVEAINKIVCTLQLLIEQKKLHINVNALNKVTVYADIQRIYQVISNLLINALKYSPNGSTILIDVYEENQDVYCKIENKKSTDSSTYNQDIYQSIGYGLDIVHEVLQQHHTTLKAEETSEYYCVCFILPKSKTS